MLTPEHEEQLWALIHSEDPQIQQHAVELVRALEDDDREHIVTMLMDSTWSRRWQLAACCLLERTEALRRTRLFAARCALRRLEQCRAAGQEPDALAWQLLEAAESLANGTDEASISGLQYTGLDYARCWEWDEFAPPNPEDQYLINSSLFRFNDVPEYWQVGGRYNFGVKQEDLLPIEPWNLNLEDELDRAIGALQAAGAAVQPWQWGYCEEGVNPVPAPRSRHEQAWQRAAWEALMRRGRDPVEMIWAPIPRRARRGTPSPAPGHR